MIIKSINDFLDIIRCQEEVKTIRVPGMAMSPEIKSGDIVALKKVNNLEFLEFGESYLVITDPAHNSLRLIRKVFCHEENDKLILRAVNPDFLGDLTISKDSIVSMFRVNGILRERYI
jgi:hypothetical protein